ETVRGVVPDDVLDGVSREVPRDHHHHDAHGWVARSWIWAADAVFHRGRLLAVFRDLPVARAKGLFRTDEGWIELQRAADDGYASAPTDLAEVRDGVLVHSLGDGPLPDDQGGPFRLLIPSDVACANVKGVVRIAIR